jgi:Protein of unknown function (DUF3631)
MTDNNKDHLFLVPADRGTPPPVTFSSLRDAGQTKVPGEGDGGCTIDGVHLLDDLHGVLTKFIVFPSEPAADAVTLWITVTHVLRAFDHAPRLNIKSPEKRCGKSRLLDVVAGTCHQPLVSVHSTVPAIFRSLDEDDPPTLLFDEADVLWGTKRAAEGNEDLRGLLNAGFQRGRPVRRCVGPEQTPTDFPTFAMAALAGIGDSVPDTITDRAINVLLRRRRPDDKVAPFRDRRDGPALCALRDRLTIWGREVVDKLKDLEPDMPVEDRAADTWEPLVAVADVVGGEWPQRARLACKILVQEAEEEDEQASVNLRLLSDIRAVFLERKMPPFVATADLLTTLKADREAPWCDWNFTSAQLSRRLKHFGIRPGVATTGKVRGYRLDGGLSDAFVRYLRQNPSSPSNTGSDLRERFDAFSAFDGPKCQMPDGQAEADAGQDTPFDTSSRQTAPKRQMETASQTPYLTDLTASDVPPGGGSTDGSSSPDKPEGSTCTVCQGWLDPALAAEGETTHPSCDPHA